jgi:lysophospholipase L1-like esterase
VSYVLFFPGHKETRRLLPTLQAAGIEYLDYVDLFDVQQEGFEIKNDGHPTAKAYRAIATRLAEDLRIGEGHEEAQGERLGTPNTLRVR